MAEDSILKIVSMDRPAKKAAAKQRKKRDDSTLRILDILQENLPKPEDQEEEKEGLEKPLPRPRR